MAADPVLIALAAKRTADGKVVWNQIGHALPHETGAGLTVILTAAPLDGRIYLVEPTDREYDRLVHATASYSEP